MQKIPDPILITGCARSGTSMTAGVVNICGAWGGKMSGITRNNRRGMFENSEIRENITKPFLRSLGVDPLGQNPLPDSAYDIPAGMSSEKLRDKVYKVILSQGYDKKSLWFYKGAKMCLSWYIWASAFPKAKWIIVRRDAEDIISSCLRTGFMRAYRTEEGWREWVKIHEKRFSEMKNAGLAIVEVYPQEMIDGDFSIIEKIVCLYGLQWREKEVKDFICPDLWSGRNKWQEQPILK